MTVYIFYVISDRQVSEKAIYVFECMAIVQSRLLPKVRHAARQCDTRHSPLTCHRFLACANGIY